MSQRKQINHYAFNDEKLNEKQKYWLGFLLADGCVSNTEGNTGNPQISLGLQSQDRKHIEKFKNFMGSEHKIIMDSNNNPLFKFRSEQVPKDLERFGIIQRKGYEGTKVKRLENDKHFWRGVIDGDGTITQPKNNCRLALYGCKTVLNQFKNYSIPIVDHEMLVKHKLNNTYMYRLNSSYARKMLNHLYTNQDIALERKERRAISHLTSHDYTQG